jgi:hypothetical protein
MTKASHPFNTSKAPKVNLNPFYLRPVRQPMMGWQSLAQHFHEVL